MERPLNLALGGLFLNNTLLICYGSGNTFPITFNKLYSWVATPHDSSSAKYPTWADFGYDVTVSAFSCRYPVLVKFIAIGI